MKASTSVLCVLFVVTLAAIRPSYGFALNRGQAVTTTTTTTTTTAKPLFQSTSSSNEQTDTGNNTDINNDTDNGILIPGKHKWLGGAVDSKGRIYGVPSNAESVICLSPPLDDDDDDDNHKNNNKQYEMHSIPLPPDIAKGQFKWLRGIIWQNYLYGIPAWSQHGILRVDIASFWNDMHAIGSVDINAIAQGIEVEVEKDVYKYATVIPLPKEYQPNNDDSSTSSASSSSSSSLSTKRWLWHGASLNKNQTAIYAIPSNAQHVLKLDLQTQTTSLLPIPTTHTPLEQTNKWYGGILGDDNAIYGVPYAASGVLRIDAENDVVELIGEEEFGVMEYNWHGGLKCGKNGRIYCFPAHHSHVLSIDTRTEAGVEVEVEVEVEADGNGNGHGHGHGNGNGNGNSDGMERLELLPIHRAPYDTDEVTRYKWLGGSMGLDGNVYGMPSDASSVLR